MTVDPIMAPALVDGGEGLLGIVVTGLHEWTREDGVASLVSPKEPMQVLVMQFAEGHEILPHGHVEHLRTFGRTQETLVVLSGRLEVSFYTYQRELVAQRTLRGGDMVVLLGGGHGMRMLEPTRLIEVKTGPYYGRAQDKFEFVPRGEET